MGSLDFGLAPRVDFSCLESPKDNHLLNYGVLTVGAFCRGGYYW